MQHTSLKNVMFHANDIVKHSVYWSEINEHWSVENARDGWLQSFDTLCSALTNMHVRSTPQSMGYGKEYCMQVPDHWTTTKNPYL